MAVQLGRATRSLVRHRRRRAVSFLRQLADAALTTEAVVHVRENPCLSSCEFSLRRLSEVAKSVGFGTSNAIA